MTRYIRRAHAVDAVQWLGTAWSEDPRPQWVTDAVDARALRFIGGADRVWVLHSREGTVRLPKGYWLLRGVAGELYPCEDAIFRLTYARAVEHA